MIHYITKTEPTDIDQSLVDLYRNSEDLDSMQVKSLMAKIAAQVIGRRVQSQQEAALKCLVQPLVYSSRTCISLDTRMTSQRRRLLKSNSELEKLSLGDKNLFRTGMIDYYYCRPSTEEFEKMCAVQFLSEYDVRVGQKGMSLNGNFKSLKVVKRGAFRFVFHSVCVILSNIILFQMRQTAKNTG